MIRSNIRRRKSQKAQINGAAFGGSSGYAQPPIDLSNLFYVPFDPDIGDSYTVPDKPVRAKEGIHSDKTITAAGDIIARTPNAVVFAAADDAAGGSQYLYQLLDVNITNPVDGAMLVYDASTQKWEDVGDFIIEGGQYSII